MFRSVYIHTCTTNLHTTMRFSLSTLSHKCTTYNGAAAALTPGTSPGTHCRSERPRGLAGGRAAALRSGTIPAAAGGSARRQREGCGRARPQRRRTKSRGALRRRGRAGSRWEAGAGSLRRSPRPGEAPGAQRGPARRGLARVGVSRRCRGGHLQRGGRGFSLALPSPFFFPFFFTG